MVALCSSTWMQCGRWKHLSWIEILHPLLAWQSKLQQWLHMAAYLFKNCTPACACFEGRRQIIKVMVQAFLQTCVLCALQHIKKSRAFSSGHLSIHMAIQAETPKHQVLSLAASWGICKSSMIGGLWVCLRIRCPFLIPDGLLARKKGHLMVRHLHVVAAQALYLELWRRGLGHPWGTRVLRHHHVTSIYIHRVLYKSMYITNVSIWKNIYKYIHIYIYLYSYCT